MSLDASAWDVGLHPTELRRAFGCMPSAVVALGALDDEGKPDGMVVSTAVPVSLDPPLISVCVQNTSTTWPRLRARTHIGVSVLSAQHDSVSRALCAPGPERFAGVQWSAGSAGEVFVSGAALLFACTFGSQLPAGDHAVVLLAIRGVLTEPSCEPLVFHRSSYRRLAC